MARFIALLALAASVLAASILATAGAAAQSYPTKPIRMIVPYPPGGANDLLARLVGDHLYRAWGQPVVIENRPGASGNIGAAYVAGLPGDGYAIMLVPIPVAAVNVSLFKDLPYDPQRDFAPIAMIAQAPNVLVVSAASPIKEVRDLIERAKANPGALNYGAPGLGTSLHLATALFANRVGVSFQHIVYLGNTHVLDALLKGEIDFAFDSIQQAVAQHKRGAVRALAVTSAARWPGLADVPTLNELGVPDTVVMAWFTVLAPAKTPDDIAGKLNAEINRGLALPEARERLTNLGMEPVPMSRAELDRYMRAERERWAQVVKAANIKVE
jgi:tripartite-type tricarboxylate transporter receptor subunit TctC